MTLKPINTPHSLFNNELVTELILLGAFIHFFGFGIDLLKILEILIL